MLMIDAREEGRRSKKAGRDRDLGAVRGIAVHHWGVSVSARPRRNGSQEARWVERARAAAYHLTVFPGAVVWAWGAERRQYHGGPELNGWTVGIGLAGKFHREIGREADCPREFLPGLWAAIRWVDAELEGQIERIVTHSQTSTKVHDPGAAVARELLLDPRVDPDWSQGRGRPWEPGWRQIEG